MALVGAIKEGDITKAEQLIENQHDLNEIGEICEYRHKSIYRYIETIGTTVSPIFGTGLMVAVAYQLYRPHGEGSTEYLRLISILLNHPQCDINVYHNNEPRGFDEDNSEPIPATAFQLAIASENTPVAQLLIKHHRFKLHPSDLVFVCYHGNITLLKLINDMAEEFMSDGFNFNYTCTICFYNDISTNIIGTPSMAAVCNRLYKPKLENGEYYRLINILLNHTRCDPNFPYKSKYASYYTPTTAWQFAIASGDKTIIKLLFNHPRVTKTQSDLTFACAVGNTVAMQVLRSRYNINQADASGRRPLHQAVVYNHPEIVKALMDHSADYECEDMELIQNHKQSNISNITDCDFNIRNKYNVTSIIIATLNKRNHILRMLIDDRRCDKTALTDNRESALSIYIKHCAQKYQIEPFSMNTIDSFSKTYDILCSSEEMVNAAKHTLAAGIELLPVCLCEQLLKSGADVNSAYPGDETALHIAVRLHSCAKILLLLRYKANVSIKWLGLDALEYAQVQNCDDRIIQLFTKGCESETQSVNMEQFSSILYHDQSRLSVKSPSAAEFQSRTFQCYTSQSYRRMSEAIGSQILKIAEAISQEIENSDTYTRYCFSTMLGGSMAEGSKTFEPNEFDLTMFFCTICGLQRIGRNQIKADENSEWLSECDESRYLLPLKVAQTFYFLVRRIINAFDKYEFSPLVLSDHPFDTRGNISRLKLLWRDDDCKDMVVYVDLAPAFRVNGKILIAKKSRHFNDCIYKPDTGKMIKETKFHRSDAEEQRSQLLQLPLEARQGLLMAKAARVSGICHPGDLGSLSVCDDIDATSIITSYHLKNTLLVMTDSCELDMIRPIKWAQNIYESIFKDNKRSNIYENSQKDVIMSICKKIINFFEANATEFNEISDDLKDVDLIPLKYSNNMLQMSRVYQRPKVDKQRVDANGFHKYRSKKRIIALSTKTCSTASSASDMHGPSEKKERK